MADAIEEAKQCGTCDRKLTTAFQIDSGRETEDGFLCDECARDADIDSTETLEIIKCGECDEPLFAETGNYDDFPIARCNDVAACNRRFAERANKSELR